MLLHLLQLLNTGNEGTYIINAAEETADSVQRGIISLNKNCYTPTIAQN